MTITPAVSPPDILTELVRQIAQHMNAAEMGSPADSASLNQQAVIESQAASLASAQQALELMLQLLEAEQGTATGPEVSTQTGPQQQPTAPAASAVVQEQQAAARSLREVLRELREQMADPQAAADREGAVIASQAASLASAHQAMQLVAQLLDQGSPHAAMAEQSAQTPVLAPHSVQHVQQAVQDGLQQALAELQAQAAARSVPLADQGIQASPQVGREACMTCITLKCCAAEDISFALAPVISSCCQTSMVTSTCSYESTIRCTSGALDHSAHAE